MRQTETNQSQSESAGRTVVKEFYDSSLTDWGEWFWWGDPVNNAALASTKLDGDGYLWHRNQYLRLL